MTVRELVNFLSTLSESDKDKQLCFAKSDAQNICDVYENELSELGFVGKYDVTIYIKDAWREIAR